MHAAAARRASTRSMTTRAARWRAASPTRRQRWIPPRPDGRFPWRREPPGQLHMIEIAVISVLVVGAFVFVGWWRGPDIPS
jgi:hypothetical protein